MTRASVFFLAFVFLAGPLAGGPEAEALSSPSDKRSFRFTYEAVVSKIDPSARRVEIWLPVAADTDVQRISDLKVEAPSGVSFHFDPEYGNKILNVALDPKGAESLRVRVSYTVRRKEDRRSPAEGSVRRAGQPPAPDRFLQGDRLVPVDDFIKSISDEVVRGKNTPIERAAAIYDYTVETMKYDKSGTGWGNGDLYYACDIRRGNCTDFHALFIGLARAAGIPAKFVIGFPIPAERGQGAVAGYHCWAEFFLEGHGWVPVDTSEAAKDKSRKEYFFGTLDPNRIEFTTGRDILLAPPQKGERLNYFIYPYVEVDGKAHAEVERKFTYQDLPAKSFAARRP
ncbi:MAG: transglutaminase domain-containing protein [Nitrospirae bacterium]|nr:transglutaminase domain-containing protein [Nitrospirota bacterium]MBI3391917.1 transglutaminase domain-containing protein [Nitrospirota bacterium]